MLMCSWDIRDQIQKLSKIVRILNIFAPQILLGAPLVKLVYTLSPQLCATSPGKISCGYVHIPKVIVAHYVEF